MGFDRRHTEEGWTDWEGVDLWVVSSLEQPRRRRRAPVFLFAIAGKENGEGT